MKINMHGPYDHFPNHHPAKGQPYVDCYLDFATMDEVKPNSIALLIEPRSLQGYVYDYIQENYKKFKYIFTHDSKLLYRLPNAKLVNWGGVWTWSDEPKTKFCSMISSGKEYCELHKIRKQLAFRLQDTIDCFGTYNGGQMVDTHTSHAPYMFAVVMENYRDDYWFTEKLCNCFANKTIPIYYGAKSISDYFNKDGIIVVDNTDDIPVVVENIKANYEEEYNKRIVAVNDNYKRVEKFRSFEERFFSKYEKLLMECEKYD